MPSQFEQLIGSGVLPSMYAQFGLSAIYTAQDGSGQTACTIRVHRGEVREATTDTRVSRESQTAEIFIQQSAGITPMPGGRFTVENTEVWTVVNTPVLKNQQFHCTCARSGPRAMIPRSASDA